MKRKTHQLFGSFIMAIIATAGLAQAVIVKFDLSPAGTSAAEGLSPANEIPAVTVPSTGSGNEISGGITYDTEINTLSLTLGYGNAAGFTNLTGAATAMHIHGPASAGAAAPVLVDLSAIHFAASPATQGGIIYGSAVYTDSQETALLNNLHYINIHTAANPGGEIRGQLVRVNVAPEVVCPEENITVECGENVTYTATVSDFDGDAIKVEWRLNGTVVKSQNIAAGTAPTSEVVNLTTKVHDEVNSLTITATDSEGDETVCEIIIKAQDTVAPVIRSLTVNPKILWPPNRKLVSVWVDAKVTDACGPTSWRIVSVSSNQRVGKKPDWDVTGAHKLKLRAERNGSDKNGRTYTIKVQAKDEAGNKSAIKTVTVTVPHDRGN